MYHSTCASWTGFKASDNGFLASVEFLCRTLFWPGDCALRRGRDQRRVFRENARDIVRLWSLPLRHALAQHIVREIDFQQLLADVEVNHVAIANAGDGTSERRFGGNVSGH